METTNQGIDLASLTMTLYYGGRRIAPYRARKLAQDRLSVAHGPVAFPEGTDIEVQWSESGPLVGARVVHTDRAGMQVALKSE